MEKEICCERNDEEEESSTSEEDNPEIHFEDLKAMDLLHPIRQRLNKSLNLGVAMEEILSMETKKIDLSDGTATSNTFSQVGHEQNLMEQDAKSSQSLLDQILEKTTRELQILEIELKEIEQNSITTQQEASKWETGVETAAKTSEEEMARWFPDKNSLKGNDVETSEHPASPVRTRKNYPCFICQQIFPSQQEKSGHLCPRTFETIKEESEEETAEAADEVEEKVEEKENDYESEKLEASVSPHYYVQHFEPQYETGNQPENSSSDEEPHRVYYGYIPNSDKFTCDNCGQQYLDPEEKWDHICEVSDWELCKCVRCGQQFDHEDDFINHACSNCKSCKKFCNCDKGLKVAKRRRSREKFRPRTNDLWKCAICGKYEYMLDKHTHHICKKCKKEFPTKKRLMLHRIFCRKFRVKRVKLRNRNWSNLLKYFKCHNRRF